MKQNLIKTAFLIVGLSIGSITSFYMALAFFRTMYTTHEVKEISNYIAIAKEINTDTDKTKNSILLTICRKVNNLESVNRSFINRVILPKEKTDRIISFTKNELLESEIYLEKIDTKITHTNEMYKRTSQLFEKY